MSAYGSSSEPRVEGPAVVVHVLIYYGSASRVFGQEPARVAIPPRKVRANCMAGNKHK